MHMLLCCFPTQTTVYCVDRVCWTAVLWPVVVLLGAHRGVLWSYISYLCFSPPPLPCLFLVPAGNRPPLIKSLDPHKVPAFEMAVFPRDCRLSVYWRRVAETLHVKCSDHDAHKDPYFGFSFFWGGDVLLSTSQNLCFEKKIYKYIYWYWLTMLTSASTQL